MAQTEKAAWGRRFLLGSCAYLLFLASVTGCEREPSSARGARVGSQEAAVFLIGPGEPFPMWPAIVGGAQRYARGIPYFTVTALQPRDASAEALDATVDEVLRQAPAAICLYVADPAVARSAAERITRKDVLLITMGARIADVHAFGHVQPTFAYGAETLGDELAQLAHGKQSYVLLHENGRTPLATECYARFMAKASRQYTLSLLEESCADGTGLSPRQLVQRMLQKFPHVGLVVTLTPEPWLTGTTSMLLRHGNHFATLGAVPQLWPYLRSGQAVALVGPLDGEIGYSALNLVGEALSNSDNTRTERVVLTEVVTPETLDDFARRYAAAAGMDLSTLQAGTTGASQPASGGGE